MSTGLRKAVVGVLVAGVILALVALSLSSPRDTPRYPELAGVDGGILAQLRAFHARPAEEDLPLPFGLTREGTDFAELVRSLGPRVGLPLVRLLLEENERKDRGQSSRAPYFRDQQYELVSWLLAELRDPSLDAPLVRMLRDHDLHVEGRRGAIIALSWPGHRDALPALLELALDRGEENDLRLDVLHRLPRIGAPAPAELRRLLHEPFGDIATATAAALAILGDLEGLWLVREGLRDPLENDRHITLAILLAATEKITGESFPPDDALSQAGPAARARALASVSKWIDAHPGCLDSEFGRARRAYMEGERRKRELALRSFDDILAAREDELDLASAALLLSSSDEEARGAALERIDRLAEGLRSRLAASRSPEETIGILNDAILKRKRFLLAGGEVYLSFLPHLLRLDSGNCIGYSTLYLALAERLGLPLHGVLTPEHVFVRWDDGLVRRNIELTDGGRELRDEEYARRPGSLSIAKESIDRGTFLASLTKKQVLAGILGNLAAASIEREAYEDALEEAGRALLLDPRCTGSRVVRAGARYQVNLRAEAAVLADLDEELRLHPASMGALVLKSLVLREAGRVDKALGSAMEAVAIEPRHPAARAEQARCLSLLGRHEEAATVLDAAEPSGDATKVEIEVRMEPTAATFAIAARSGHVAARLLAARALLEPAAGTAPDPEAALKALGTEDEPGIRHVERKVPFGPGATQVFIEEQGPTDRLRRQRHVLRGRALLLQGNAAAAREELALAEAIGPVEREIRKLRRDLEAVGR